MYLPLHFLRHSSQQQNLTYPHGQPEDSKTSQKIIVRQSLVREKIRHKVNPGFLYTPEAAGIVEFAHIIMAVKSQRVKYAVL